MSRVLKWTPAPSHKHPRGGRQCGLACGKPQPVVEPVPFSAVTGVGGQRKTLLSGGLALFPLLLGPKFSNFVRTFLPIDRLEHKDAGGIPPAGHFGSSPEPSRCRQIFLVSSIPWGDTSRWRCVVNWPQGFFPLYSLPAWVTQRRTVMRCFILVQTVTNDWFKRQQDALVDGMIQMRADSSPVPRYLVQPTGPSTPCEPRRRTSCALRRHSNCLTGRRPSCEGIGLERCVGSIAVKNPSSST